MTAPEQLPSRSSDTAVLRAEFSSDDRLAFLVIARDDFGEEEALEPNREPVDLVVPPPPPVRLDFVPDTRMGVRGRPGTLVYRKKKIYS